MGRNGYSRTSYKWYNKTPHSFCTLDTYGYKYILRICDNYWFSITTMISRILLTVPYTHIAKHFFFLIFHERKIFRPHNIPITFRVNWVIWSFLGGKEWRTLTYLSPCHRLALTRSDGWIQHGMSNMHLMLDGSQIWHYENQGRCYPWPSWVTPLNRRQ